MTRRLTVLICFLTFVSSMCAAHPIFAHPEAGTTISGGSMIDGSMETKALAIALREPEINELTDTHHFEVTQSGYFPQPEIESAEISLTLTFSERFIFNGMEIEELLVLVDHSAGRVSDMMLVKSDGSTELTPKQAELALSLAFDNQDVAKIIADKNFKVEGISNLRSNRQPFTNPAAMVLIRFDRSFDNDGVFEERNTHIHKSLFLDARLTGVRAYVSLQEETVTVAPLYAAINIGNQYLVLLGLIAVSVLLGGGIYLRMRQAGCCEQGIE